MGTQVQYGSIAVGAYYAHLRGTLQPGFTDQYLPRWDRGGARGPRTWKDRNRWVSLWPRGSWGSCGADASTPYLPYGQDYSGYEPYSCDGEGTQTLKFIKGQCVDASDVAVAGAIVQGFRTSDDTFAGYEVTAGEDGSYDLPTNFPGVNHYLVAYKAGSPDTGGTTVNTLVPTNIDGT